ncbi:unnamed protein product [Caenorhabditis bovis]|uniref:Uncharacterized protein n=1 Tax=Caenorhabditis bovis TaxID=2654633 RepID=A0A8S1EH02_9PELO|nr:unnamed protein product [Caenorhabditis bovis]
MPSIFSVYCYTINGLAVFFNIFLLLISTRKSVEAIRELRYFLSNVAVCLVVFAACVGSLQPQMATRGSMNIRIIHGPARYLAESSIKFLASIAVVAYLYSSLSFALFFVYRLMILSNSSLFGQYFNRRTLLIAFIVLFIICCFEGIILYFAAVPYNDLYERLNRSNTILESSQNDTKPPLAIQSSLISNHTIIEPEIRPSLFGDDFNKNPLILIFHGSVTFVEMLSFVITLVCAHFMLKILKRKQGVMSQDMYLENEAIVHTVFAQAFVPFFLSTPIAVSTLLAYIYGNSLVWQEYIPTYLISLVPLITPILSLVFITPYWNTILHWISFEKFRSHQEEAVKKAATADT